MAPTNMQLAEEVGRAKVEIIKVMNGGAKDLEFIQALVIRNARVTPEVFRKARRQAIAEYKKKLAVLGKPKGD